MRELCLALPEERRTVLAADMFDTARALVLASLPDVHPADEVQVRLRERLYGTDLARRYRAAVGEQSRQRATRTSLREHSP